MKRKKWSLGRHAYPVVNTLYQSNDIYLIPATATHIWANADYDKDLIFDIYADMAYHTTTPMHCGRFGFSPHHLSVPSSLDKETFDRLLFDLLSDWDEIGHPLAKEVVRQISEYGEVDCAELIDTAKTLLNSMIAEFARKNGLEETLF